MAVALFCVSSVCKTGLLDTLDKESLTERVENHERRDNHQAAGVSDRGVVQILSCETVLSQGGRNRVDKFDQQIRIRRDEEQVGVEVVGPLPAEREQEHRNQHRD